MTGNNSLKGQETDHLGTGYPTNVRTTFVFQLYMNRSESTYKHGVDRGVLLVRVRPSDEGPSPTHYVRRLDGVGFTGSCPGAERVSELVPVKSSCLGVG